MYINSQFVQLFHSYLQALKSLDLEQYSFLSSKSKTDKGILKQYYNPVTERSIAKSFYKNNTEVLKQVLQETSDEPISYKMQKDLSILLQDENQKGQKQNFTNRRAQQFISLLELLYKRLRINHSPIYLTKSAFYREKFNYLEMGGLQYAYFTTQGRVGSDKKASRDYTPTGLMIYPAYMNSDYVMELLIPKIIGDAFNFSENSSFLMGTFGINTDILIFFPLNENRDNFKVKTVNGEFLSDGPEEGVNFRSIRGDIFIYRELIPIEINVNYDANSSISNTYRLKVPQAFLQTFESETSLLEKSNDKVGKKPAFAFSFDMYGNLVYERILFTEKEMHKDYLLPGIKLHDLPSEVPNYDAISTDDLTHYKMINEVIED